MEKETTPVREILDLIGDIIDNLIELVKRIKKDGMSSYGTILGLVRLLIIRLRRIKKRKIKG